MKLDPILTFADCLLAVRDAALDRLRGPRCRHCDARTRHMPAHIAIDHAEVTP